MGLFKNLFGGDKTKPRKDDIFSPQYKTIRRWIESRVGTIDLNDPDLVPRLKKLGNDEYRFLSEPFDRLNIEYSGNNTIILGENKDCKKQLRKLGFKWDKRMKAWIIYDQKLNRKELQLRCLKRTAGLQSYIDKIEYRVKLEGK